MRKLAPPVLRSIASLWVLALAVLIAHSSPVFADDRSDARAHYQAGVKFYNGGDYKSAIREFSAAQQLAPADLNNYNLALCYDKLGDAEPAIQYYRTYLDRVPNTDKRGEIEASVARLEAATKSIAAKKAEEAKKAEDAKKAEEARQQEELRKAEEARRAEEAKRLPPEPVAPVGPVVPSTPEPNAPYGSTGSSLGTPSSGTPSTGDPQLDRVNQIDINQIRDQRMGPQPAQPGPTGAMGPTGAAPDQTAAAGTQPSEGAAPNAVPANGNQDQPQADPVYKKWWFWAVVAVSAYVVYQIATEDSDADNTRARMMFPMGPAAQPGAGGVTLMRW
ncbi:MAG: tol-pal system YbgF family protein [Kofleriaceae bacterium]